MSESTEPAGVAVDRVVGRLTALDEACYGNEAADRELAALRAEAEALRTLAKDAHKAWDADKAMRVGKLLIAMIDPEFRRSYRPDLTPNAGLSGPAAKE